MNTTWDLNRLEYTIRKITGLFDQTQIPTTTGPGPVSVTNPAGVYQYINDYYLFDFPEHLRTLKLKDFYLFQTIPNVGTYNVPQNIFQLEPPFFVDGYQGQWFESPASFYGIWPEFDFINYAIGSGNGGKLYNFTLTQTPILQGSVVIGITPNMTGVAQYETFTDTDSPSAWVNPGVLTGSLGGTGTINYLTGAVTLSYANAVPTGTNINVHYRPYVASRPRDAMFYKQQLFIRPVPIDVYSIKLVSYVQPTTALGAAQFGAVGTDAPLWNEWWQVIAYGAAIKILIENGDHDEAQRYMAIHEQQKNLAQRRELKNLGSQRIPTVYSNNWGSGSNVWPIFPTY